MRKIIFLAASHIAILLVGFGMGVYTLPLLIAPPAPSAATLAETSTNALFSGTFKRDLKGSDFLHWGNGTLHFSADKIVHQGELAPGPDYKLYLVDTFVEDEESFLKIKDQAYFVGEIKTFDGFILETPTGTDLTRYTTAVIWCETFSEFITAAKYR